MYFPFKSAMHLSQAELACLRKICHKNCINTSLCKPPLCSSCQFQDICHIPRPCSCWAGSPYLPLHTLKSLVVLGLVPQQASITQKRRKLLVAFKNGQCIRLSFSVLANSSESLQNVTQVLLRNPNFQSQVSFSQKDFIFRHGIPVFPACIKSAPAESPP